MLAPVQFLLVAYPCLVIVTTTVDVGAGAILQRDGRETQNFVAAAVVHRCFIDCFTGLVLTTLCGLILRMLGGRIRWRFCCLSWLD